MFEEKCTEGNYSFPGKGIYIVQLLNNSGSVKSRFEVTEYTLRSIVEIEESILFGAYPYFVVGV